MKKVYVLFIVAVLGPSLILAWLAARSVRDQQVLIERQRSLLFQTICDRKANDLQQYLLACQHEFSEKVSSLLPGADATETARSFDDMVRKYWPLAEVGFVVTTTGQILSPRVYSRAEARDFLAQNSRFLANTEPAEVYLTPKRTSANPEQNQAPPETSVESRKDAIPEKQTFLGSKDPSLRKVVPQSSKNQPTELYSKATSSETEFRQLVGTESEGMMGRFFDNRLSLIAWTRPVVSPNLIFGAKVNLTALTERLAPLVVGLDPAVKDEICLALLDDLGRPVAISRRGFSTNWKRPFVATEVGELLPHWETAVYLIDPATSTRAARTLTLILSLVILTLVLAIALGSGLLARDISRRLTLARQKTDFVSNVSHELKTPLTSIRIFAEMLAEGRVATESKRKEYLEVITKEAARLTRMVDEVLDFARAERKERSYRRQHLNLARITTETLAEYQERLEAAGLAVKVEVEPVQVKGDPDALAQVLLNLLSNAEKYAARGREVHVRLRRGTDPGPAAIWQVLDRGPGVAAGNEEKIFEQFYRADDALSSGIRGTGLGLTVARQIVRAHGGDITYTTREGGGSCFTVRLPLSEDHENQDPGD